jgi:asparagine synthetase B (glutamine-hydrolysing)
MCGISGRVNCRDSETLERTVIQAHRGPDDAGLSRNKETVLAC